MPSGPVASTIGWGITSALSPPTVKIDRVSAKEGALKSKLLNCISCRCQPRRNPIGRLQIAGTASEFLAELRVLPKIGAEPHCEIVCVSGSCL